MERAVGRFVVVEGVLPAARILARLVLTAPDVLSEVYLLHWRHILPHALPQILERNLAVSISIEPGVQILDLGLVSLEPPSSHHFLELWVVKVVATRQLPLNKGLLECLKLPKCFLYKSLLKVAFCYAIGSYSLIRPSVLNVFHQLQLKLGVLFGVMSEEEAFCWLDA